MAYIHPPDFMRQDTKIRILSNVKYTDMFY